MAGIVNGSRRRGLLKNVGGSRLRKFDFEPIVILIRAALNFHRRNDESPVGGQLELLHQIRIVFREFIGRDVARQQVLKR